MKEYVFKRDSIFAEMSIPMSDIIKSIRNIEYELNKHLLKILLFNQKSTWKKDAISWLIKISTYTTKPRNNYLKKGQYYEYLFSEPFENGIKTYKQSTIYKYCSVILNDPKYKKLNSYYRKKQIPVKEWKELLKQFYIEVDDYMFKGIFDIEIAEYLIDTFIVSYKNK
jgi:hypothetical protein